MKSIKYSNDDLRMEQIIKCKMSIVEKIIFILTGKLVIHIIF